MSDNTQNEPLAPPTNPFERLDWISLSSRRTKTFDKRLAFPRVGYAEHP